MKRQNTSRWYWPVLGGVIILALSLALLPGLLGGPEAESIEQQVDSIAMELWCPVCDGQTAGESRSPAAEAMKDIIREKLHEGWTRQEILDYFVDEYGVSILTAPPSSGLSIVTWAVPFIGLLGGAFLIRKGVAERNTLHKRTAEHKEPKLDDKTEKEIDEELKRYL